MTKLIKTTIAASVLAIATAGSAFALVPDNASVLNDLRAAQLSTPNISVSVNGGIVTLTGDVQDGIEKQRAANAVLKSDGVNGVINLITSN